ncbi:MAG: hypothetical protein V2A62_01830 [Candidatus Woesearchaeota archaeon]
MKEERLEDMVALSKEVAPISFGRMALDYVKTVAVPLLVIATGLSLMYFADAKDIIDAHTRCLMDPDYTTVTIIDGDKLTCPEINREYDFRFK